MKEIFRAGAPHKGSAMPYVRIYSRREKVLEDLLNYHCILYYDCTSLGHH